MLAGTNPMAAVLEHHHPFYSKMSYPDDDDDWVRLFVCVCVCVVCVFVVCVIAQFVIMASQTHRLATYEV